MTWAPPWLKLKNRASRQRCWPTPRSRATSLTTSSNACSAFCREVAGLSRSIRMPQARSSLFQWNSCTSFFSPAFVSISTLWDLTKSRISSEGLSFSVLELDLVAVEVNGLDGERVGEELLGRLPGFGLLRCRKRRGGLLGGGGLNRFSGGGCAFGHTITSLCWRGFFRIAPGGGQVKRRVRAGEGLNKGGGK